MSPISNSELAILSLIAEKPMHAYEIETTIEERNIRDWTELGFSSIYRHLSNMEGSGFITGEITPPVGRGPARKIYTITEKGGTALNSAVLEILKLPERRHSNFLLALDNLMRLPGDQALSALTENKTYLEGFLTEISKMIDQHPMKDDFFISSFFSFITSQLESELNWLSDFINKYQSHIRNVNKRLEKESNE